MGWIDFSSNGFCALKWLIEEQSITVGRTAKTQCICVRKPLDKQTLIVYQYIRRNDAGRSAAGAAGGASRQRADPRLAGGNIQGADPEKADGTLRGRKGRKTVRLRGGLYGCTDSSQRLHLLLPDGI